ncbi:MAG: hypothetical protein EXR66_05785 [Dehalococcoidia bacterium]|nr:hypothetical protein [Dehalococcoidia bacterium]
MWSGLITSARSGQLYKYRLIGIDGETFDKADPFAAATEVPPGTASRIADLAYDWHDAEWLATRGPQQTLTAPISIYELHLGSWRRPPGSVNYRAIAAPPRRARPRLGLHACGSAPGDGAPVLRVVGISDHGLPRADIAVQQHAGPHVPHRLAASTRDRRDS